VSLSRVVEHLRYRRFLDASVDGELTGEHAGRVRAHVATCPRCARDEDITIVVKRSLALLRRVWPTGERRGSE
jgi:predicted anti-sigma-YlaC factor YlaD